MSKRFLIPAITGLIAVNLMFYILLNDVCVALLSFSTPGCPRKPIEIPTTKVPSDSPHFRLSVSNSSWEYILEETKVLEKTRYTDPEVDTITLKAVKSLRDPYLATGGFGFRIRYGNMRSPVDVGRATLFKHEDDGAYTLYVYITPELFNADIPQGEINRVTSSLIIGELLRYDEIIDPETVQTKTNAILTDFDNRFRRIYIVAAIKNE